MKFILVAGVEELGKDSIVKLTLERFGRSFSGFGYINFDNMDVFKHRIAGINSFDRLKDSFLKFYEELDAALIEMKKKSYRENILINGYLTLRSEFGYVPLVTDNFFRVFKPDIIVLIEGFPEELGIKPEKAMDMREHQAVNRVTAIQYASELGIPLKVIRLKKSEATKCIQELYELLKSISGD